MNYSGMGKGDGERAVPVSLAVSFGPLCEFDRFCRVVDVQAVAVEQHRSQQRVLPIAGGNLRLIGLAESVEEAGECFQFDASAVRQDRFGGRLPRQPQFGDLLPRDCQSPVGRRIDPHHEARALTVERRRQRHAKECPQLLVHEPVHRCAPPR